jgi:hypothetical protein
MTDLRTYAIDELTRIGMYGKKPTVYGDFVK